MTHYETMPAHGYYKEKYRPHLHFTPEQMWMNDPNGLVYFEGEYHLFYQYHPYSTQWGPMHWGHAVSRDLVTWEHLPVALHPDEQGMIFSGSAVVDHEDTTGFFDGGKGLVAVYTSADGDLQRQSIAYSKDRGRTWAKYDGNPVLENPGIADFRDPKVFWHSSSSRWVMVLAAGKQVQLFTSENLKQWTFASSFGEGWGEQKGTWECPDLFPMINEKTGVEEWVLMIGIDAGGPCGGSGTQYFTGVFDGSAFFPDQQQDEVKWLDFGKDFYAAQSFSDLRDRRVIIAWMSNWQYANDVPTYPWRSAMTLPRELMLTKVSGKSVLKQMPVADSIQSMDNSAPGSGVQLLPGSPHIQSQPDAPFVWKITLELQADSHVEGTVFHTGEGGYRFGVEKGRAYVVRDECVPAFSDHYAAVCTADIAGSLDEVTLTVVCDFSSVEMFVNTGEIGMTNLYFPQTGLSHLMKLESIKGYAAVKDMVIDQRPSIWAENHS
ncbi:glycoside hydrolase family 32 protein [Halobacillus litoralis]|uniref:glycoside hydrolase family 32 protein n=1 Tax=Halobacillus litoralis TaxID=45668 RepID=UPI0013692FC6|nr:glycoside hydrolase family 32 protein [Halobacillus litoralis]MYL37518.1 glycoside hydrolase family 32 protein [Halobacillus litoralis]